MPGLRSGTKRHVIGMGICPAVMCATRSILEFTQDRLLDCVTAPDFSNWDKRMSDFPVRGQWVSHGDVESILHSDAARADILVMACRSFLAQGLAEKVVVGAAAPGLPRSPASAISGTMSAAGSASLASQLASWPSRGVHRPHSRWLSDEPTS